MTAQPQPQAPALARAGIDRAAQERPDADLIARLRADAATRVLAIHGDRAPLAHGPGAPRLHMTGPEALAASSAPLEWAFLGRLADGSGVLAAVLPADAPEPFAAPGGWSGLREVGGLLDGEEASVFVEALCLGRWLLDAPFCPACGTRCEVRMAGWSRLCPQCGREHFPRTDPAVIVAVESTDGTRLLLGSNVLWGRERYSCFAGFVEAGESLESAIAREIEEESGITVASTRYAGSQAWPYPRSLMLGFQARALDDAAARADGEEIAQVRWFTREEIREALDGRGALTLPGPASIAHHLITGWCARW